MEFDWFDLLQLDGTSDLDPTLGSVQGDGHVLVYDQDMVGALVDTDDGGLFSGAHDGLEISGVGTEPTVGAVTGDVMHDARYYHAQTYQDTCALVVQQGILKEYDVEVTETQLRQFAHNQGWYTPGGGTPLYDVGNVLEHFGIGVHRGHGASMEDLVSELRQGHKVIVGLDASEISTPEGSLNPLNWWRAELPDAGHAVWVTGIDLQEGVVYMNDPGSPTGQATTVSIEDFKNAWEDYGNYYCATNAAPH